MQTNHLIYMQWRQKQFMISNNQAFGSLLSLWKSWHETSTRFFVESSSEPFDSLSVGEMSPGNVGWNFQNDIMFDLQVNNRLFLFLLVFFLLLLLLLFVVCCLLFVVCCLLFVVCFLLFVVCCLLFVVCCLLLVLGSWFLVLGSWFLVLGFWFLVLGSSSWFLVLGSWFLVVVGCCWLLVVSSGLLVGGCWLLVRGWWLPAADCWLLVAGMVAGCCTYSGPMEPNPSRQNTTCGPVQRALVFSNFHDSEWLLLSSWLVKAYHCPY